MKPTIGRIVHWTAQDGTSLPAIIVAIDRVPPVWDCHLQVFSKGPVFAATAQQEDEGCANYTVGHWHWPPREPVGDVVDVGMVKGISSLRP